MADRPRVRFYCLALPSDGPQLGFDYLEAIERTNLGVRACPIGPAFLMAGPWPRLSHLFMGEPLGLRDRFVNVVCAPPGLSLGFAMTARDVAPPPDLPGVMKPVEREEAIVYQPKTALSGLYTVGVKNVAITMPKPAPPDDPERQALLQYDFVLCPSAADAAAMGALKIPGLYVPPDAAILEKILVALLDPIS